MTLLLCIVLHHLHLKIICRRRNIEGGLLSSEILVLNMTLVIGCNCIEDKGSMHCYDLTRINQQSWHRFKLVIHVPLCICNHTFFSENVFEILVYREAMHNNPMSSTCIWWIWNMKKELFNTSSQYYGVYWRVLPLKIKLSKD